MTTAVPWAAIKALFETCVDLPADAREPLITAAALDAAGLAELRSLLAHHDQATGAQVFMTESAAQQLAEGAARQGQRLGAWEIVRAIGAGGMGEVFEARRADGSYDGRAAVKLLKRGMDSAAVLQRFAQERQALARLNHPHIARLLDAGASEDGLPYFVLEFVDGQPIDEAVRPLTLEQRLKLFLQLADAVAHAHRNLLVHRDLKPGNVLVDTEGQVKLLDFGIAKALDPLEGLPDQGGGNTTVGGVRPYTPNYASPEQVRGEPVSTATDIYSLGVLLYQMLTGIRPTGRRAETAAAAARSVLDEVPTRPSTLGETESQDRSWPLVRKQLAGDLDNILLKALEKSPERRYPSVDAFAADIHAHLQGRPVSARPASLLYLTSKFVQRNRAVVWTGGAAVLGLTTAVTATLLQGRVAAALGVALLAATSLVALVQARRAASARDAATRAGDDARAQLDRVKRITTDLLFRYGDTVTHLPGGAQAQEAMLRDTIALLEPALQGSPDDIDLMATMASVLGRLAEIQGNSAIAASERASEATTTAERALALAERAWPHHLADWRFASWHVRTLIVRGQLLRAGGKINEARALLELAASRARASSQLQRDGEGHMYMGTGVANSHLELALVLNHPVLPSFGLIDAALDQYRLAEQALRALLARRDDIAMLDRKAPPGGLSSENYLTHQIGAILGSRALIYLRADRLEDALAEAEAAMQMRRRNIQREPRNVWWRHGLMSEANVWAMCELRLGRAKLALEAATLAWDTMLGLARDEGEQSKWARPAVRALIAPQYGWALLVNKRPSDAAEVLEPALAYWRNESGPEAELKAAQVQQHLLAARAAAAKA